ncbi:IS66 family transposase [Sulfitobacter geojensis]|uniref:IS66 family transposase n=1 Tax=Sulfitobacter geojensis TaxID=1342299 RepID=UPI003B8A8857
MATASTERSRPRAVLLTHLPVNKYAGHLPLCCQSQTFNRDGINLERSTLAD